MAPTPPHARRWQRRPSTHTVLAEFSDRECLGKLLDLSEAGVGAVLQGTRHRAGERLRLLAACPGTTLRFRGVVVFAQAAAGSSRVGIRLEDPPLPPAAGSTRARAPGARRPGQPEPRPVSSREDPRRGAFRVNIGVWAPLVRPADEAVMATERSRLLESVRGLGVSPGTAGRDSLLAWLHLEALQGARSFISRELFRSAMRHWYPSYPGTTLRGRLVPASGDPGPVALKGALVTLDRFAVAEADASGRFTAEGIPILDAPAVLPVGVRGAGLGTADQVFVSLCAGVGLDLFVELPLKPVALAQESAAGPCPSFRDGCGVEGDEMP
ncbi:MAG: PilZ domain-containing protein [Deferrisomatales bacterium]